MTPSQVAKLKRHFSRSVTIPRHTGKSRQVIDKWRNDLQAPITSRRRSAWRKWLACACLAILGAAGAGLTWIWFYW
jgi:hypothetical protein